MAILTKAGNNVLRRTTVAGSSRVPVPVVSVGVGTAQHRYKSTNTHVPFPAGIISSLQISRHIYEQEGFVPEEVTLSYAVSPAEIALRSSASHTAAANVGAGNHHRHGLLWSHWHPGPTAGVEYQTRQFSASAGSSGGGLKRAAAVSDPSIWEWGDRSHTQPDHMVAAKPIMPGDEHYDPVTINDMPSQSEANVKADRSDIDPLHRLGALGASSSSHSHHSHGGTQVHYGPSVYQSHQSRQFFSTSSSSEGYGGGMSAAAVHDPSIWEWGDRSHTQPDHKIPPRPIWPGDPHYDPVTINDMPSQSEANVKADRSDIDPLPMGLHKVIPLPAGEAIPGPTESEWDVRADRSSMEEDPLRDRMSFRDYGPLMAAGRRTEQEIKRDSMKMKKKDNADNADTGDMYDMPERGDSESMHSGYGYYGASSTSNFSGGEMWEGMESTDKKRGVRQDRLFMEDFGEEDESLGTTKFGEGEGREGYEGERGYFGEEGPATRRRYGMEEMVGMDKSAEEMELEDAMLPHFTRFY
ncbi:hypothetical protein B0T09DRAFT_183757 [Sordaria sp. MPI-SDFR-AT-0083]|nr:hypothetical protein B0T09DRAFT_183757 [Sordaria sp. MPI-SDFR-AT-0083]